MNVCKDIKQTYVIFITCIAFGDTGEMKGRVWLTVHFTRAR